MAVRLTKDIIDTIRKDNKLSFSIAEVLGIQISSLPSQLTRPTRRLTEYQVLKVISDFTGKKPEEFIEEVPDEEISEVK